MTAADWSAIAAWATLAVAVTAATFAAVQTLGARADRRERQRPQVDVDAAPWPNHPGLVRLTMSNIGETTARNIRLAFDPPLPKEPPAGEDGSWEYLLKFVQRTWAYVPPGKAYSCFMLNLRSYPDGGPRAWDVTVECDDYEGREQPPNVVRLDLDNFAAATFPETKSIHDLVLSIEQIQAALVKLPIDSDGLHVVTETEAEAATRRSEAMQRMWLNRYRLSKRLRE